MQVSGIILAGGISRRMGADKALLPLGSRNVIQIIASEMITAVERVSIAVGAGQREAFAELGHIQAIDQYPGSGPLAGLHAGLASMAAHSDGWSLIVPCDTPLVRAPLFTALIKLTEQQEATGIQALVPVIQGQIHPLIAMYHSSVTHVLQQQLEAGKRKVMGFLEHIEVQYVTAEQLSTSSGLIEADITEMFTNMNHRDDYERIKRKYFFL